MVLLIKALSDARKQVHKHMAAPEGPHVCTSHHSCGCACKGVCATDQSETLQQFLDMVMCPRAEGQRHYRLECVLGTCVECGFDQKVVGMCPVETDRQECWVTTRQHVMKELVDAKGKKKKVLGLF